MNEQQRGKEGLPGLTINQVAMAHAEGAALTVIKAHIPA